MTILQIITLSELGGAQSVVVNLANALCKEHDVIVAAGQGDGKMFSMLDERIKREHCPHLQRELSPIQDFLAIVAFRKLYKKYKPDIIHLHSSKVGILGRITFPPSKTVYTVHGFDSIRIAYRKFLFAERMMQKRCKAIVAVSSYDKQNLKDERIKNHVCCIYNGINKFSSDANLMLSEIKTNQKKVLCIARVAKPKRFDIFIKTAQLLPEYAFYWIGNQDLIDNVPQNVYCLGNKSNAGAYNQCVDLFMLPSNYEGLPMTIIEAMSFGKPIVASNVGGISEIVINNENGFTVENTAEAFAEKIKYILENQDVYDRFAKNSLDRFNKELTVDKMVDSYLRIYKGE